MSAIASGTEGASAVPDRASERAIVTEQNITYITGVRTANLAGIRGISHAEKSYHSIWKSSLMSRRCTLQGGVMTAIWARREVFLVERGQRGRGRKF